MLLSLPVLTIDMPAKTHAMVITESISERQKYKKTLSAARNPRA